MNKKIIMVGLVFAMLITSVSSEAFDFYIVPGSLVYDKIYDDFDAILDEGFWFLVIDNTGAISAEKRRNDAYVIYDLTFSEEGIQTFSESFTIPADTYHTIAVNFNQTSKYVTEAFFTMHSSRRISAFITDPEGLAGYFEEVGRLAINIQRPIVYSIVGLGVALVGAIITSSFVTHKREERDELISQTPPDKIVEPGYCRYCGKTIRSDIKICNACKRRINKMGKIQGNIG